MVSIDLSPDDVQLIDRTLKWRLSMLLTEIHHTDTRDFRDELKRQATQIERLLERLTERRHASGEMPARA
jgi:hypothetical protein